LRHRLPRRPARRVPGHCGETAPVAGLARADPTGPEPEPDRHHWHAGPRSPGAAAPRHRSDLASSFLVFLVRRDARILDSFLPAAQGDGTAEWLLRHRCATAWPMPP